MDELEKLLAEEEKETPATSSEAKAEPEAKKIEDSEVLKKEEIKANLDRAIAEAHEELRQIRSEKQRAKKGNDEEELPKIDLDDPSAKAWNKHIQEQVSPVQSELEKEKAEIRQFAMQEFLTDKPYLISHPEKVKELMGTYERIRTSTERTKEGVLLDLDKAYAATFHKELFDVARGRKVDQAKADALFSEPAISKGATGYTSKDDSSRDESLTEEDRAVLAKWGMSPQEYQELRKKYK